MANTEDTNTEETSTQNSAVRYKASTDVESVHVDVQSPAKNRYKGTCVSQKPHKRPVLFERASRSWWDPKFDSKILEDQLWDSYFPQTQRRFQYTLFFVVIACISWIIFFSVMQMNYYVTFIIGTAVLFVVTVLFIVFTLTRFYERFHLVTSILFIVIVAAMILSPYAFHASDLSTVGTFTATVEILLMIYTFVPMPLFAAVITGTIFSVVYEVVIQLSKVRDTEHQVMHSFTFIFAKILLHLCIHLIGIHIFTMSQVRRRSTFWKIGQSAIARRDLQVEKQLKEKMIHSLMPPSVAADVMRSAREDKDENDDMVDGRKKRSKSKRDKGEIIFRPFNMNKMSNVSILFADIVGFTKMSSNKTAEHLVGLLNDLFGRFDKLCTQSGCEKISTLGDCYYCVCGCPEERADHAKCCVEMGLGMIKAIKAFDEENNESVNMRVGVHTGTVLCGIVGTRRFKFDVWSNDVTLANIMESTGKPGMVHISNPCYEFLADDYVVSPGEDVEDINTNKVLIEHYDITKSSFTIRHREEQNLIKTYFIIGSKKKEVSSPNLEDEKSPSVNSVVNVEDAAEEKLQGLDLPKLGCAYQDESDERGQLEVKAEIMNTPERENSGVNGVTPAALLGRRHSSGFYAASTSSLEGIADEDKPTNISCCMKNGSSSSERKLGERGTVSGNPRSLSNNLPTHQTCQKPNHSSSGENDRQNGIQIHTSGNEDPSTHPINEAWKKLRHIRDQNDRQIIKCIREDITNKKFFYEPNINKFTLSFQNRSLEEDFRDHYQESHLFREETVASPRYIALLEVIFSIIVFTLVSICCFMVFEQRFLFIVVFQIALFIEILNLINVLTDILYGAQKKGKCESLMRLMAGWYFRNFLGSLVAALPAVAVFSNLTCNVVTGNDWYLIMFCSCAVVSLVHFCNFTMLSSWVKSVIALIGGVLLIFFTNTIMCPLNPVNSTVFTQLTTEPLQIDANVSFNINLNASYTVPFAQLYYNQLLFRYQIIVDVVLLLLLIFFINREFEISYRSSYHGSAQAEHDKTTMQENKDQADWLLHNIIPEHVSELVKKTSKYSKNHKDCGVIFATLVNFNEFYDESYEGGREYLRVLNELVSDYEVLLDREEFKDVEKIKTISSSFMAASGLNEQNRVKNKHPYAHLHALLSFAMGLQKAVDRFNESIFNFEFILNVGFNFGEVTAGVIGTTKLLYDIWGDTVNIASRMYSTGVANRIQVPEAAAKILEDVFEFEYRGEIFVKGKGQMKTYLVVKRIVDIDWDSF